jgi:hypothetical protein
MPNKNAQTKVSTTPALEDTIKFLFAQPSSTANSRSEFLAQAGEARAKRELSDIVGPCISQKECREKMQKVTESAEKQGKKIYAMRESFDQVSQAWYAKCI